MLVKTTAATAILERLATQRRRVVSDWRALLLLRQATIDVSPDERRWSTMPDDVADIYPLLRQMVARGEITPLPKLHYTYAVTVPYARTGPPHEDEVLMEVNPYATISHLSALVYHRLTDDLPQVLTAMFLPYQTAGVLPVGTASEDWEGLTLVIGRRPDIIVGQRMRWVRVTPDRYFGVQDYRPSGYPVRVTTPERTLVDGLQAPDLCGGFDNVLHAWARARDSLNLDALVSVVEQFNVGVLRQRVGFILDQLDLTHPSVEAWRAHAQRGGSSRLLATAPYDGTTYSERWNLSINAPISVLTENVA